MKDILLKTIILINLIFNSSLFAINEQDFKEIVDSFKLKDTTNIELFQDFKVYGSRTIKIKLEKQEDSQEKQDIQHIIFVNGKNVGGENSWSGVFKLDQKLFAVSCISKEKKIFLASVVRSSFARKKKIHFGALVSRLDKSSPSSGSRSLNRGPLKGLSSYIKLDSNEQKKFYPYYNEKKMLERLYETETCNKEETEKANIKVLVDGEWIDQEKSWKGK